MVIDLLFNINTYGKDKKNKLKYDIISNTKEKKQENKRKR